MSTPADLLNASKELLAADDAALAFLLAADPAVMGEDRWGAEQKSRARRRVAAVLALRAAIAAAEALAKVDGDHTWADVDAAIAKAEGRKGAAQ